MTASFTATPLPEIAAIRLRLAGAGAGPATITRTDANGTRAVRLLPGQVPVSGVLTVTDYEPALTGAVTYTADTAIGAATPKVTGLTGQVLPWLTIADQPQYRVQLPAIEQWSATSPARDVMHDIIDRPDPIPVIHPTSTRRVTTRIYAPDYATAAAIRAVLDQPYVCLIRQATYPGMDAYLRPTRATMMPKDPATPTRAWWVELDATEVQPRPGPLLGAAGWTIASVRDTYPTIADMKAALTTVAALRIGP